MPGIAHDYLSQWLGKQGAILSRQAWTPNLVKSLQGLAYSNSVVEVIAINQVHTDHQEHQYFLSADTDQYQLLAGYFRRN